MKLVSMKQVSEEKIKNKPYLITFSFIISEVESSDPYIHQAAVRQLGYCSRAEKVFPKL